MTECRINLALFQGRGNCRQESTWRDRRFCGHDSLNSHPNHNHLGHHDGGRRGVVCGAVDRFDGQAAG